jgi:hypothetical protein
MFIHHIVDGLLVETWRNADDLGRVLQLGARIVPAVNGDEGHQLQEKFFYNSITALKKIKGY